MKLKVKKVNATRLELNFEVPKDRVAEKMDEVYQELGKVANVKGFRKGKVPRHILESHYADVAKEEALKKIIPEVYQEGLKQESIVPLDYPAIENVDFNDKGLTFLAKLDIHPEVTVKDYKGINVKKKSTEVTDEDINKTLEYFKAGQGKDKETPIDDDFAKGLGYPSLDEFKKSLSHQIGLDKDRANRMDIENQVVEHLLKKSKLVVPKSLVDKHLANRLAEQKKRLQQQGLSEEDIKKKEADFEKELKGAVEKDIKVYFIMEKIAELEKLEIKQGENLVAKVIEYLLKEAKWEEK